MLKIKLNSVLVRDQDQALRFYAEILGFSKKVDLPMGPYRWLTVVSPKEPDGTQLVLEPNAHPAAQVYQKALFEDGIPLTSFAVDDLEKEYERLTALGVVFRSKPTNAGNVVLAVFEDTCGNLIQIFQEL